MGHTVSHNLVAELLHKMGCSLQVNQKAIENTSHSDRNDQFEYISTKVKEFQRLNR
ncbi:hypothetical protein MBAV_003123 [Candidatus Magnetobacterium bavaricum]|uniref:Transposase n=1 Tax=Candidatus Magnetobacterium bavaricum TaxID=29290 RepID=A0A0F3GRW3_9BACT|nr:hypothetical protein MBAV_003123 [Candidatus Magnetobacterium bavaricum]